MRRSLGAGFASILVAMAVPAAALAFDPQLEAKNFAKTSERVANVTGKPEFLARLHQQNLEAQIQWTQLRANDPERNPANVCARRSQECAGDIRFYDWEESGYGLMTPVIFTARSGAVISGMVWGTVAGPERRPGIVITTGSVQAPETLYWGLAASFAKAGYIVLTYDVQGQGQSDTFGEAPDQQEGVPSQAGQPFYDGTEDALDFLLSGPANPYDPRPSCGNANDGVATDHSPKHDRRVGAGLATAFNPMHERVDPSRIAIAGHSLGASAVSFIGQRDPRVDAIVAWDNLAQPGQGFANVPDCPSNPDSRVVPAISKPAMGISNDYGLTPTPFTADPDPQAKNGAFQAYSAAAVDSMQVNIRGGTHYESSLLPCCTVPVFAEATWRGQDFVQWYTQAWFDKYVKGDPTADVRLLTDRWRNDTLTQGVDQNDDPNMFSFYYRSRYEFSLEGGGAAVCDDIRTGCAQMGPDGAPPNYDFVAAAQIPDGPGPAAGGADGDGVADPFDSCPTTPGPAAGDGCPQPQGAAGGGPQPTNRSRPRCGALRKKLRKANRPAAKLKIRQKLRRRGCLKRRPARR
jgi:dienelactone hydrolase